MSLYAIDNEGQNKNLSWVAGLYITIYQLIILNKLKRIQTTVTKTNLV